MPPCPGGSFPLSVTTRRNPFPYPFHPLTVPLSHARVPFPFSLSTFISRQESNTLALSEESGTREFPAIVAASQPRPLQFSTRGISVVRATPDRRPRRKSMARRSGQVGYEEVKGGWYHVRFRIDVLGREKRAYLSKPICPVSGPGALTKPERLKKRKEIIAASRYRGTLQQD